jgi:hypothetical protein
VLLVTGISVMMVSREWVAPVVTTAGLVGRQTHRVEPALAQAEVVAVVLVGPITEEGEGVVLAGQEPLVVEEQQ